MYLAAMGFGLGALVDGGDRGGIDGVAYVAFIAPGVLAATAMQTAAGECTFPIMAGMKWNMYFHAILATPLRVRHLVLGHLDYLVVGCRSSAACSWSSPSPWARQVVVGAARAASGRAHRPGLRRTDHRLRLARRMTPATASTSSSAS